MKLLTIIIPSYNMEKYLHACLDSILDGNAMADRLDVIVVNDGSEDGTSGIAHQFEAKHLGIIRVIDKKNGNYGSCVNAGLREARGLYVKILDADDTFDSTAFSRYLRFLNGLRDGSPPDVVFNDFVEVDPDGNVLKKHDYALVDEPCFTLARFDYHGGRCVWMHALAYRTDLLREIDYRQTEGISYTDQEWSVIPMLDARSFRHCPESVYRYLVGRPGQTCDESVQVRNYRMHFPVAERIVRAYEGAKTRAPAESVAFAQSQIHFHLLMFYRDYLVTFHTRLDESELARFDRFLKETDEDLYRYPDTLPVLRGRIPFRFVREWRRRMTRRTLRFRLLDAELLLYGAARRIFRFLFPSTRRIEGGLP